MGYPSLDSSPQDKQRIYFTTDLTVKAARTAIAARVTATDGAHGTELWKSDGTAGGTVMVKDLNPAGNANPAALTLVNHLLLFSANDGATGSELWALDITTQAPQPKVYIPLINR